MDFFKKSWVRIVALVIIAIGVVVLYLGGTDEKTIVNYIGIVIAGVGAIIAIVKFIIDLANKNKIEDKSKKL